MTSTTPATASTEVRRGARLTDGVDQDLRYLIPEGICRTFRVMPYAAIDGTVLVAAADADDTITAHVVAERIDRPVRLVRHTVNEITAAIDSVYPPQGTEVETPEARRARMQMAQMLTRSGLITDEQLQRAMLEYSRTGDPLGDILVSHEALAGSGARGVTRLCAAIGVEPGPELSAMAAAFREVAPRAGDHGADPTLAAEAEALHGRLVASSLMVNQT